MPRESLLFYGAIRRRFINLNILQNDKMKENIFGKIRKKNEEKLIRQGEKISEETNWMFLGLGNEGAKEEINKYQKDKLKIDSSNKPNLSEQEGDYGDNEKLVNEEE
jgi:hypothetical protein